MCWREMGGNMAFENDHQWGAINHSCTNAPSGIPTQRPAKENAPKRYLDVDAFPVGTRVKTPSGRTGVVIRHKGYESRHDNFLRVTVQMDGGNHHDLVTLQPHLLVKCPEQEGSKGTITA